MEKEGLSSFFTEYLKKESLFLDKKALQNNYTPQMIPHRDEQIEAVASVLAPSDRQAME